MADNAQVFLVGMLVVPIVVNMYLTIKLKRAELRSIAVTDKAVVEYRSARKRNHMLLPQRIQLADMSTSVGESIVMTVHGVLLEIHEDGMGVDITDEEAVRRMLFLSEDAISAFAKVFTDRQFDKAQWLLRNNEEGSEQ